MNDLSMVQSKIATLSSIRDAQFILEQIRDISKSLDSEYPEAANYIDAVSGFLIVYHQTQKPLDENELRAFCDILLYSLFYE